MDQFEQFAAAVARGEDPDQAARAAGGTGRPEAAVIPAALARKALGAVIPFAANKVWPVVRVEPVDGEVAVVATDSRSLCVVYLPLERWPHTATTVTLAEAKVALARAAAGADWQPPAAGAVDFPAWRHVATSRDQKRSASDDGFVALDVRYLARAAKAVGVCCEKARRGKTPLPATGCTITYTSAADPASFYATGNGLRVLVMVMPLRAG